MVIVINSFGMFEESFTISNMTEKPQRRRSSWTPPPIPEWNQTRSSWDHLRDSLFKDDEVGASCLQADMPNRLNFFKMFKSPRRRDEIYVQPADESIAERPNPPPKPWQQRTSSTGSQTMNPHGSATSHTIDADSQSDYVQPSHLGDEREQSESHYLTMHAIMETATSPNKSTQEKQNGMWDSQEADDTFLNKVIDGHLICNICNKRYDQPKMLKCFHSFCTHCLSEKIQHQKAPMGTVSCPICAEDTPIPGNGVSDLRDNILIQALIDDVSEHETSRVGQRSDNQVLLQESKKSSKENKILNVHDRSVKTYEVMRVKKKQPLKPLLTHQPEGNLTKCLQHPKRSAKHFCTTCKRLICLDCLKFDHIAPDHRYTDAALVEEHGKTVMKVLLDMVKKQKLEYFKSVSSLEDTYCRLHNMIHNTTKKILDQERYQIRKIKEKSAALQEEVAQLGNERAEMLDEEHKKHCEEAEMVSHNQEILEHALYEASQLEFLIAKDNVVSQCNEKLLEAIPKPMHKLSFLDFAEAQEGPEIIMGHLLQIERWELQEELAERDEEPIRLAGYIAMYSNGDIAVTDMLNWQITIISQDNKKCKRIEKSNKPLVNPFGIAINKDDKLLVIDQNKVKVFDKEIKLLFEIPNSFSQSKDDESTAPSIITCLAVDKLNRIAVGNRGKKNVSLHRQDGWLLRTLKADLIDTQMTMATGERIIYTNYHEKKLISMDYKGEIVFCVSTTDKSPTGVCCDTIGFIYVAVHSSFQGTCAIHHYNRTGEFIGCTVEGLNNPLGIIFTPKDKLAVADNDSVRIYRRV